jgi:cell division septation protein DedD
MATREGELFVEKIEVNLDGRQIFCLFCGGAVIASLVFVLGVTVGRRVEAREHGEALATAAAGDPLVALDDVAARQGDRPDDLTFASTLRGEREGDPLGAVDLSLDRPAPAAARAAPSPVPRADREPAVQPEPKPASQVAAKPETKPEPAAQAETRPETKPEPAPVAEVAADAARFTLHLLSFQNRPEADALVSKLKKAGYAPYVVETEEEGKGTFYRVRVGQYADYESAVAGKTDFEKKQQIIAYVTRTKR